MTDITECILEFDKRVKVMVFDYLDQHKSLLSCAHEFHKAEESYIIAFNGNRLDRFHEWKTLCDMLEEENPEAYRTITYSEEYAFDYRGDMDEGHAWVELYVYDDGKAIDTYEELKRN